MPRESLSLKDISALAEDSYPAAVIIIKLLSMKATSGVYRLIDLGIKGENIDKLFCSRFCGANFDRMIEILAIWSDAKLKLVAEESHG